jgi:glyoxylase-like metal-dependent hydrolase (beta-lactamase superfamily II)
LRLAISILSEIPMSDFYEIDFLGVETAKSGDAIAIRYQLGDETFIHVVDGGYLETGEALAEHIRTYYGNPRLINNVVATHPDRDHAGGLRTILEEFDVGTLWMLRPWIYGAEILPRFKNFTS